MQENKESKVESQNNNDSASIKKVEENKNKYVKRSKIDYSSRKFKNILIACFIAFIVLACLSALRGNTFKKDDSISNNKSISASSETGISKGVDNVYDSVVYITNYKGSAKYTTGTGFVYKKNKKTAYVITNYHVISGATTLKVILSNGTSTTGRYIGGDKYIDVAVISIPYNKTMKVATLGSSKNLALGSTLFTIGIPVGEEYRGTVTRGILSGKDRLVSVSVNGNVEDYIMKVLQTDTAMSPGNSGGPLCNAAGEVIGVNSMKFVKSDIEGMAFAVPIEDVTKYLESFEKGGSIKRPSIGITMINLTDTDTLNKYNIVTNTNLQRGVVINSVEATSNAYGKINRGDIIYKVNGVSIKDIAHLRYEVFKYKKGDKIAITYERGSSSRTIDIVLQ